MRFCHITANTTSFDQAEVTGAPFPVVFCCSVSIFTNMVSADSGNTCEIWPWKLQSVMLGISHVIPRDSQLSLTAKKNPFCCFGKDMGGIDPFIGVWVISNIWLMIYCLEETFICGSVARPRQTWDDESVYEERTCQFNYYFKGLANRKNYTIVAVRSETPGDSLSVFKVVNSISPISSQ